MQTRIAGPTGSGFQIRARPGRCSSTSLTLLAFALFGFLFQNNCVAAGVYSGELDQSYFPAPVSSGYVVYSGVREAQTFHVGLSGLLSEVDLEVAKMGPSREAAESITQALTLSIFTTLASGEPGVSLGSVSIPASAVTNVFGFAAALTAFDLRPANINVQAGQQLALVVSSDVPGPTFPGQDVPSYGFLTDSQNGYSGGTGRYKKDGFAWGTYNFDFGFQTFVVPEPSAASMVLLGMAWRLVRGRMAERAKKIEAPDFTVWAGGKTSGVG